MAEKEKEQEKKQVEKEEQKTTKAEPGVENKEKVEIKSGKGKDKIEKIKKEKAVVRGADVGISTKHSMAICRFIRNKNPEQAIAELEKVAKLKKAIPMKGEIPHRKGMMSGRYPVNASKVFIKLIKQLIGNSNINGLENPYISLAKVDRASRPHKRSGSARFKRTNVYLEAREKVVKERKSANAEQEIKTKSEESTAKQNKKEKE